jgi:hypothetical protein
MQRASIRSVAGTQVNRVAPKNLITRLDYAKAQLDEGVKANFSSASFPIRRDMQSLHTRCGLPTRT